MNSKMRFAMLMAEMASAFDLGAPTKEKTAVYYKYLQDIPPDKLQAGVSSVIKSHKGPGMPTVAAIREAALGVDEDTMTSLGLDAWRTACKRLSVGRNGNASDDIDEAVLMAFGSWTKFGLTDPENEGFDRAHFIKCYRAIHMRHARKQLLLAGDEKKQLPEGEHV